MHKSDIQGWIRVALFVLLMLFVLRCSIIDAGSTVTDNPTTPTQETTPEPQDTTEPTCTIPTQEETTPQTEPPTIDTEPPTEQAQATPETTGSWQSLGTYTLTAYCSCQTCCDQYALNRPRDENGNPIVYTASGAIAQAGTTIAVDPSIIPYGSKVKINEHIYIAQDTGGAINGNRVDVYFNDHQEALQFGLQTAEVFLQIEGA